MELEFKEKTVKAHETCALCHKHITSIHTRNIGGEFYFCSECYDGLIYPAVNEYVSRLVARYDGETPAEVERRERAIEVLRPKAEPRIEPLQVDSTL